MAELLLGVNIDHIATLRNARGTAYPDPVQAAFIAEQAGADGITVHLREDRRHITDRDVRILRETLHTRMNLEMAVTEEMLTIACETKPHFCCLGAGETSGSHYRRRTGRGRAARQDARCLSTPPADAGIPGLPCLSMRMKRRSKRRRTLARPISKSTPAAMPMPKPTPSRPGELERIAKAATYAASLGLKVNAGHGLTYHNVKAIAALPEMHELNIGHAIIGRAVMSGLKEAVAEMKRLMLEARG